MNSIVKIYQTADELNTALCRNIINAVGISENKTFDFKYRKDIRYKTLFATCKFQNDFGLIRLKGNKPIGKYSKPELLGVISHELGHMLLFNYFSSWYNITNLRCMGLKNCKLTPEEYAYSDVFCDLISGYAQREFGCKSVYTDFCSDIRDIKYNVSSFVRMNLVKDAYNCKSLSEELRVWYLAYSNSLEKRLPDRELHRLKEWSIAMTKATDCIAFTARNALVVPVAFNCMVNKNGREVSSRVYTLLPINTDFQNVSYMLDLLQSNLQSTIPYQCKVINYSLI